MRLPANISTSTGRLRTAGRLATVGVIGLCVTIFMPQGEAIRTPILVFSDPDQFIRQSRWVLLLPFLMGLILFACRIAAWRRGPRAGLFAGLSAAGACVVGLIAMDIGFWQSVSGNIGRFFKPDFRSMSLLGLLALLAVATLASASLAAAPSRVRVAACGGILGILSSLLLGFILIISIDAAYKYQSDAACFGLFLSVPSSLLMAVGGVWETVLLWRTEEPEGSSR